MLRTTLAPTAPVDGRHAGLCMLYRSWSDQDRSRKLREWFVNGTVVVEGVGRVKPHIPDETFFPTVLMRSGLRVPKPVEVVKDVTGSGKKVPLRSVWYVRMDEHYPWSSHKQRYEAPSHLSTGRPWGPYYVGSYDLGDIKAHRALFVRGVAPRRRQHLSGAARG